MKEKEINLFFENQLKDWPLAKSNFEALLSIKKKNFKIKDLKGYVQYNPQRAASSLAKIDKESIKKRECFLCSKNRPAEQKVFEILPGWELLVNPFPILPYHFTIASTNHATQKLNLTAGKLLAEQLPGMVVFFNDIGAGASAPDHTHFQAVPIDELPLIRMIEINGDKEEKDLSFPFKIINETELNDEKQPVNVFIWKSGNSHKIKVVGIPRKAHRPACFYQEGEKRRAFSPGAIDMAGVLVTPFEEDFERISSEEIERIYSEVGIQDE